MDKEFKLAAENEDEDGLGDVDVDDLSDDGHSASKTSLSKKKRKAGSPGVSGKKRKKSQLKQVVPNGEGNDNE